ncbi:MAG: IMP cyclohydrolase [Deltaproteobacteria bacterium]|nr:IMP cyclohydrolase [Deltaproteobacteria bacterium]
MTHLQDMYRTVIDDAFPDKLTVTLGDTVLTYSRRVWNFNEEIKGLRYGENPDQPAALYRLVSGAPAIGGREWRGPGGIVSSLSEAQMLQAGKHPGKTNLTDVDNGINILQYLTDRPAAVILKHNNPCGAAWSRFSLGDALSKAFWCDRIAAFGGAVVCNRPLDLNAAELIAANYFEVVAAPDYEEGALAKLSGRKNLRVLHLPALAELERHAGIPFLDIKSLTDGGLIIQQSFVNRIRQASDFLPAVATGKDGLSVSARAPSSAESDDLLFAWAVEAGVTSNSVIFARDGATTAIGTGEQDRVGCVELAIHKAYTKYADRLAFEQTGMSLYDLQQHALRNPAAAEQLRAVNTAVGAARANLPGSVLVSDGFFPFRDGVDVAIAQGIAAIAQPGGSVRDVEVITAVNEASPQVAMVFTGQRSFRH